MRERKESINVPIFNADRSEIRLLWQWLTLYVYSRFEEGGVGIFSTEDFFDWYHSRKKPYDSFGEVPVTVAGVSTGKRKSGKNYGRGIFVLVGKNRFIKELVKERPFVIMQYEVNVKEFVCFDEFFDWFMEKKTRL